MTHLECAKHNILKASTIGSPVSPRTPCLVCLMVHPAQSRQLINRYRKTSFLKRASFLKLVEDISTRRRRARGSRTPRLANPPTFASRPKNVKNNKLFKIMKLITVNINISCNWENNKSEQ